MLEDGVVDQTEVEEEGGGGGENQRGGVTPVFEKSPKK